MRRQRAQHGTGRCTWGAPHPFHSASTTGSSNASGATAAAAAAAAAAACPSSSAARSSWAPSCATSETRCG